MVVLAQIVTTQLTAKLTDSGDNPPIMAVPSDATEPAELLTPPFHVATPNAQAPRLMNIISPAIAIPYNSPIRQIEAYWNRTPLPLIDPRGTQLTEEAHTFGDMVRSDGLLEEPFNAVPDHSANLLQRKRLEPQPPHRERQRVGDRRVSVDQRAVEIEDNE